MEVGFGQPPADVHRLGVGGKLDSEVRARVQSAEADHQLDFVPDNPEANHPVDLGRVDCPDHPEWDVRGGFDNDTEWISWEATDGVKTGAPHRRFVELLGRSQRAELHFAAVLRDLRRTLLRLDRAQVPSWTRLHAAPAHGPRPPACGLAKEYPTK